MNFISAILSRRCSHCREGHIFRGVWRMNQDCPVCGIHFEREQGYWLMSVFIGYVMFGVILAPVALLLYFQEVPMQLSFIIMGVLIAILILPVFIYARVIWLYIDELLDPRKNDEYVTPRDYLDASVGNHDSNK